MKTLDWNSRDFYIAAEENQRTKQLSQFIQKTPGLSGHVFLASSGTSSTNTDSTKWVALSKAAILKSAKAVNKHLQVSNSDIFFQALTNHHIGGLAVYARAFLVGASVIDWKKDNQKWDVISFYQSLSDSKATLVSMVPTQIFDLIKNNLQAPPSLRAIVVGGAALSPEIYWSAKKLNWPLLPSFGMTETSSQIATATLQSLNEDSFPHLELLPHVEVKTGVQKNLSVKSDALFSGYVFQNNQGACEFYNPITDGWFATSDFAEVKDKTVTHLGRVSDFVKIAGELVSTVILENEFSKLMHESKSPHLNNVALAFIPDARLGSSVNLFIEEVVEDPEFIKNIVLLFNSKVRAFEKIRAVKTVKALPKTELGKVIKPQLASLNAKSFFDF